MPHVVKCGRHRLILDGVGTGGSDDVLTAFRDGDGRAFAHAALGWDDSGNMVGVVAANMSALQARGMYESALVTALTACVLDNRHCAREELIDLLDEADSAKLKATGDPLPGRGPFTIYRGVSGPARSRRVRGLSWTGNLDVACWFAKRLFADDPAVYQATVSADDVWSYTDSRHEQEFIVGPVRVRKMNLSAKEIAARADRFIAAKQALEVAGSPAAATTAGGTSGAEDPPKAAPRRKSARTRPRG